MSEDKDEISSLKQTLRTQQKLVHELYLELEAEREASSTAANEALSMILRLQIEKAADKLEAIQCKRMTQEDLNHAHQIILLFQETLRHKDMFISSLDFQLQAYRHQMLAMGLTDSQIRDLELAHPLFPLPQNNGDLQCSTPNNPSIILKEDIGQARDHEFEFYGKDLNTIFEESALSHLRSYWEQIEHLDTRVSGEVIKDEFDSISSNLGPHATAFAFPEPDDVTRPARGPNALELDLPCSNYQASDPENLLQIDHTSFPWSKKQNTASSSQSTTIHDVFEVPQNALAQKDEWNRLRNPDPIPHGSETTKYCCRDETGWSKSPQKSASDVIKRSKSGGVSVNCHLALMDLANGIFPFQNDLHRLKRRLEKFEGERGGKPGACGNEEEELSLLREIHAKLSIIQSEMRSGRAKHPVVDDECSLISLMENLFFYSL